MRLLFVGSDFQRKGGDLLVAAVSGPMRGRCELDIVTTAEVPCAPGVRVHRAAANSLELRSLFQRAELFALPTRAECFGQVLVEALASGLPVLAGAVGGTGDIVDDGDTGWLIPPSLDNVVAALERALAVREALPAMGRRARAVAEERFDGVRNDRRIIEQMLALAARRRRGAA
jgi:glycosyltransferase involved in cell wall biosynthesis